LLSMRRFGDLPGMQNCRKQEVSVPTPASEQMIDEKDLSVQK